MLKNYMGKAIDTVYEKNKLLLKINNLFKKNLNNNIKDINVECLRDKIAYISQDILLFSGTIYENMTLGMEEPDMEEVMRIAQMAKAHDFINAMPLRYETMLGENGANQRIAISVRKN